MSITALVLTGCGDIWRKIDPRNDDSITYHNKFVENTNTILEKTRATGDTYSELLTQVENATEKLDIAGFEAALKGLKAAHAQAKIQLEAAKSKTANDHEMYIVPFQKNYLPALEDLEKSYDDLLAYLAERSGDYEIAKLEELTLKIDGTHQKFIEKHNAFIDAINLQVQ